MFRRFAPALGLAVALAPAMTVAQVNIDQNKTPAQIYAGDCAVCHKSVRGLANGRGAGALTGFLSEHYTASTKEAAALAAYVLASGGGVGRAAPARSQPEAEGARATAEQPTGREARRPAKPEEKPAANANPNPNPNNAGVGRKPEPERRAAAEPGRPGSVRGPLPERRGRTRGRVKPLEAAAPAPAAAPPEAKTAVVAVPPATETPSPQASPAQTAGPAAAPPAQVPRDNIPD